jgi:hypothetical protein
MKKIIFLFIQFLLLANLAKPQGCVAIRNVAGFGQFAQLGYTQTDDKWMLDINNRYFKAYKFLEGTQNITPKDLSSGVTLYEYTMNYELTRLLNNGWSISLDMPLLVNETAGALEHASGDYHTTHATGLGDMRFTVYKWLLNSAHSSKGNIQVGLGIKFATGNYKSEDYFYTDPNDKTYKQSLPVIKCILYFQQKHKRIRKFFLSHKPQRSEWRCGMATQSCASQCLHIVARNHL